MDLLSLYRAFATARSSRSHRNLGHFLSWRAQRDVQLKDRVEPLMRTALGRGRSLGGVTCTICVGEMSSDYSGL